MKSEELKNRMTLQILETLTNENGFEIETWVDFKDLWAAVTNLHGREYFEAAAVQAENTVKFTIRYTDEIDTTMRIFFKGKQYNITSIDNIKYENKFIEIMAMEVDKSG
ncbi:phage head closure protein [Clostridium cochlearium]|uniref:phage head closure protein n=1 Tax=Clostridium cochlearium TaxID=1494 RepID=UPI00145973E0|nr:phage head closure protein [Clostridium cochlearium]MBV1817167.1 phage head closure protein [Bacteroidales bacterium MSK.15.36]MCG4579354.1 phage head closure protein [Clostridium cochlearium]NME94458.1 phage head closure protein [Clostridium cochlearium]NSJ90485.1 phage head closure protein [Coprococcus sp. MSK.21.13]